MECTPENTITYKDVCIHYQEKGIGKTVVLLHGYLESVQIWGSFFDELSNYFRVIAIDLPGHGKSDNIGNIHSMEMFAECIKYVLNRLKAEKFSVIGHSMGGYVALALADLYPESIESLTLLHSTPFADPEEKEAARNREIGLVKLGKKETFISLNIPNAFATDNLETFAREVEIAKQIALATRSEGIVAALEGMKIRPDRQEILHDLSAPTLLIFGEKDNYIPMEKAIDLIGYSSGSQSLLLHNSGHMGFVEERETVLKEVIQFVNQL